MKAYVAVLALAVLLLAGGATAAPAYQVTYQVTPQSMNPGGSAQVIVVVNNVDPALSMDKLVVSLSARGVGGISVSSGTSDLGTLPAGATTSAAFAIRALESAKPGTYVLEATGDYSYGGVGSSFKISIPVLVTYRSGLEIYADNAQITPGATEDVQITLKNAGKSQISALIVELVPGTQGVAGSSGANVYPVGSIRNGIPVITAGESAKASFQVRASDVATPGIHSLGIIVTYTDAAGTTQVDTTTLAITIVEPGTEVLVDSITSDLEPGKIGSVVIGVKNIGDVDLNDVYLSITPGEGLSLSGSNEKPVGALAVGETRTAEFRFDVSQDSEAKPVASTLEISYRRGEGKKQVTDTKQLGIDVTGTVDLRIVDVKPKKDSGQIEIDIANYGTKDADALKVEASAGGKVFATGFTDKIKPNKHKVFRFDMPASGDVLVSMTYKDYASEKGEVTETESISLSKDQISQDAEMPVAMIVLLLAAAAFLVWYFGVKKRKKVSIDLSKYK